MKTSLTRVLTLLLVSSFYLAQAAPQPDKSGTQEEQDQQMDKKIESFGWTRTGKGRLGSVAEIQIPQGYRFTGQSGCKKMLELTHNIPGDSELGVIAPEHLGW